MLTRIGWPVLSLGLILSLGCAPASAPSSAAATESESLILGKGVSLSELTEIGAIVSDPEAFNGETVVVRGKVVAVCERMGCWMELESSSAENIRIKVDDGVIVFPKSAVGKYAVAQGIVEKLTYTAEEYLAKAQHHAEQTGEEFDPSSLPGPPYEELQIYGTGARIEG